MQINWVSKGLKKSKVFWVSVLVKAGAAQDTGKLIPSTLKVPYHKWEGSLFTLGLLHNFTLVKVEEVRLTGWIFLQFVKLYFRLKLLCEDKLGIILAVDELTVQASSV